MTPWFVPLGRPGWQMRRIDELARARLRQAEVQHLHDAVGSHLDIGRLQIAMDDPFLVRGLERIADLARDGQRVRGPEASGLNDRVERLALHQLHHERRDPLGLFEAVDLRDVGMIERREQTRFALEPREAIGAAGECARQDFDRDVAPELRVARAIDLAHAAGADPRLDLVDAQTASCEVHDRLGVVLTRRATSSTAGRSRNWSPASS